MTETSQSRFATYCDIFSGPKSTLISKRVLVQSCTDWFQRDLIGLFHSNTSQPVHKYIGMPPFFHSITIAKSVRSVVLPSS